MDLFPKKVITNAAIKVDGQVFEAERHKLALDKAKSEGVDISGVNKQKEGLFRTSDQRLITRKEAKEEFGIDESEDIMKQKVTTEDGKKKLKKVEEVVACVIEYGTFISVAEKLAERMKTVYYHSPYEEEYQDVRKCVKGTGLDKVKRLDNFFDPKVFDTIDLFIFPDTNFSGLQTHLRSLGKAVWGQMGATDLELERDTFLDTLREIGLPTIKSKRIVGMTALREHLKKNEDKWIKINRYRANMETWHHLDYAHSERILESMDVIFGSVKEQIIFIVQDSIKSDMETGYDGWCIDGKFPSKSFQGYEKKNELYLGAVLSQEELADEIKTVNEAMAPILKDYGYRNWWATEIRVSDGIPYFIDPTPRMPGQTGEHQCETMINFAEVVWYGAHGIMIEPEFEWNFAAEATLHYDNLSKDISLLQEWKTLDIPKDIRRWVKLYHYCKVDDIYHFSPSKSDEVGVVIGVGDSVQESIDHLKENLEKMKGLPVHANTKEFVDLLESIEKAQEEGIKFADEIPNPKDII